MAGLDKIALNRDAAVTGRLLMFTFLTFSSSSSSPLRGARLQQREEFLTKALPCHLPLHLLVPPVE
jgi:hypothetical protein